MGDVSSNTDDWRDVVDRTREVSVSCPNSDKDVVGSTRESISCPVDEESGVVATIRDRSESSGESSLLVNSERMLHNI